MKAIRLFAARDLQMCVEPEPVLAAGETLLSITAVGLCGSDLHWVAHAGIGDARLSKPLVLGHEFTALTEKGQRVAVDPAIPCGRCEFCREGNPNLCPSVRFAGHSLQDGALRERIAWPAHNLYPLPNALSDAEGVMLEPLGVALHAVDLARVMPGCTVGVFGCGPIGLLVLQLAQLARAAQVIATEKLAHRMDPARSLGAIVFDGRGNPAPEILAATGGRGVDVAFEAAGENQAVETAIAATKPGGTVILIGIPTEDQTTFTASTARRKGLTLKLCRRMKDTYPRAIELVQTGAIDVRSLVTHRFPLREFQRAFAAAEKREGIKVLIEMDQSR